MHIKRYRGHRLPDVMRRVREDLGDDAVILHTKGNASRGLRRLMGGAGVEVVAAVDRTETTPVAPPMIERVDADSPAWSPDLAAELASLRQLILRTSGVRTLPDALAPVYARLLARGLDDALSLRLLESLDGDVMEHVEDRLADLIAVSGSALPPRAIGIAVVGPAGAGKTSVIAKLAVASHVAGLTPELLTLDGSSVGATTQLETLARIIEAPCTVALTPDDLVAARKRPLSGPRLIDTPAVHARDAAGIVELTERLQTLAPAEVHLVLPATVGRDDLKAMVRAFAPLGPTHVLFTHLDEAAAPGAIVTAAQAARRPLSFVGTGRDVTHDLEPAVARAIARRILHGDLR